MAGDLATLDIVEADLRKRIQRNAKLLKELRDDGVGVDELREIDPDPAKMLALADGEISIDAVMTDREALASLFARDDGLGHDLGAIATGLDASSYREAVAALLRRGTA